MTEKSPKTEIISIFAYWSKNDFIEENTLTYLKELKRFSSVVLFVSNSPIEKSQLRILSGLNIKTLLRENFGYDFWAWKEGILLLQNEIKHSESLILCNSSCFLAFENLSSVLTKLDSKANIWGLSSYRESNIPFHLQSYFLLFKKEILQNWDAFISFWNQIPYMKNWQEAVKFGEIKLTNYYLKLGFKCASFIPPSVLPSEDVDPTIFYPTQLLSFGSPLVKKKLFMQSYSHFLSSSYGNSAATAFEYIKNNNGLYEEILRELISSTTPTQLLQILHLNYLIDPNNNQNFSKHNESKSALICFVYYKDMINYMTEIIQRFHGIAEIFIVSSERSLLDSYEKKLRGTKLPLNFRYKENRGRNEAAYFLSCKDVWLNHDYICALHDKKTSHASPALLGIDFMKHCEQHLAPSNEGILEIIKLFENNKLLGLLTPPPPIFGTFTSSLHNPIGRNLTSLTELNRIFFNGQLFDEKKGVDVFSAPFGGMFWARSKALTPLLESKLNINDFPGEPIKVTDGTILHALERSYPLIVRSAGFYTARVMNIILLPTLFDNLLYIIFLTAIKEKIILVTKKHAKKYINNHPILFKMAKYLYTRFLA